MSMPRKKRERDDGGVEEEQEEEVKVKGGGERNDEHASSDASSYEEGYTTTSSSSDTSDASDASDVSAPCVNVAFDFDEPSESDFQALKALLNSYAPSKTFPLSALVDAVISAPSATVIRATQEDDGERDDGERDETEKDASTLVGVGAVLRNGGSALRGMFDGQRVGSLFTDDHHVVVIERLINSPPQLGAPLLGAIFEGGEDGEGGDGGNGGNSGKKKKKKKSGNKKKIDENKYVVVGKAYVSGGERGYALPEFGCLAEDGVVEEVVWVGEDGGEGGNGENGNGEGGDGALRRFVAVVEGDAGLARWMGAVGATC